MNSEQIHNQIKQNEMQQDEMKEFLNEQNIKNKRKIKQQIKELEKQRLQLIDEYIELHIEELKEKQKIALISSLIFEQIKEELF